MPGEVTKDMSKKDRRLNLSCLEIKCSTGVSIENSLGNQDGFWCLQQSTT